MKHRLRIVAGSGHDGPEEDPVDVHRGAERYPVSPKEVRLRTTLVARLADESYDGIGLIVDDATALSVGQMIEFEDRESTQPLSGVIIHLTSLTDGRWRVGIQLDESHVPI